MSASRFSAGWPRRAPAVVAALLVAAALASGQSGCAGGPIGAAQTPDTSALAPAQQALDKARAAQANDFAPRAMDAARRRISAARGIIFDAARQRRGLTGAEQSRVDALIAGARLDARSALVQTQAKAVIAKLDEMRGRRDRGAQSGFGETGRRSGSDESIDTTPGSP